jgi:hypothetical protein
MIYGGYVGWIHSEGLNQAKARIRRDFTWDKTRKHYQTSCTITIFVLQNLVYVNVLEIEGLTG